MAPQREWFEKDYYKVLGRARRRPRPRTSPRRTGSWRAQHHPDANPGDPTAEERFKEISAAYDVLGDEAKRKEYDEVRRLGPMGGWPAGSAPAARRRPRRGRLLVRRRRRRRRRPARQPVRRGAARRPRAAAASRRSAARTSRPSSRWPSRTPSRGMTTTLYLTSDAVCSTCSGSGAKPGTTPRVCRVCNGRGVVDDNQGLFSFSSPCTACQGRGVVIDDPCPTCRGLGRRAPAPRGQGAHARPASPTASASPSRVAARRAATAGRPATST